MKYIVYDTETTGLSQHFDQILQFAAVVTDAEFNIIEEVNLRCRLLPWVVPSPYALLVTGINPFDLNDAPLSHYEMMAQIRSLIERNSPAILMGYNSLGYDEGMLRNAFFQTLNPVYLTNSNGNRRMDVLPIAKAVSSLQPDLLTIPTNDKGNPSFKLDQLAPANGLALDNAHDALFDTIATLEMAKLIRRSTPDLWQGFEGSASKAAARKIVEGNRSFFFTDPNFSQATILATNIATNEANESEIAVFDLSFDPGPYLDLPENGILSLLKRSPRPIRIVRTNKHPLLFPLESLPGEMRGSNLTAAQIDDRIDMVNGHQEFGRNVSIALTNRYEQTSEPEYVEQSLYSGGFPSNHDSHLMELFHRSAWQERIQIADSFEDARYTEFANRVLFTENPDLLSDNARDRLNTWSQARLNASGEPSWNTLATARAELFEAEVEPRFVDNPLLDKIRRFFSSYDSLRRLTRS